VCKSFNCLILFKRYGSVEQEPVAKGGGTACFYTYDTEYGLPSHDVWILAPNGQLPMAIPHHLRHDKHSSFGGALLVPKFGKVEIVGRLQWLIVYSQIFGI